MRDNLPYVNIHTHKKGENELTIKCVGIHPYDAEKGLQLRMEEVDPSIEAIGEIGLDYSRDIDRTAQQKLFEQQLLIAEQLALPVVIHSVRAFEDVMKSLNGRELKAVIFHGFIGSKEQASAALKRGYYLSFGHRCFNSPKSLDALRNTPISNIFLETDESDIPIEGIYKRASEIRKENLEELKIELYKNYIDIFNKK